MDHYRKDGLKIGVIGLHGAFAFYDTVAAKAREGVEARDEIKYLNKALAELKGKVDITVLLIHEGVPRVNQALVVKMWSGYYRQILRQLKK